MYGPDVAILFMYVPHDMRHTGFSQVDGGQQNPWVLGVTVNNAHQMNSPTRATPHLSAHAMPCSRIHTHSSKNKYLCT